MKRLLLLLVVFCQLLFVPAGVGAQAKVPPKPTTSIYVQDQAGVLSKIRKQPSMPTVRPCRRKPKPRSWC